jgi:hypothetical protein
VSAPSQVLTVRLVTVDDRPTLHLLTAPPAPEPVITRAGRELKIELAAEATGALVLPEPLPPIVSVEADPGPGLFVLRLLVAPEVAYEATTKAGLVTLVFGGPSAARAEPTVADLYRHLFPVGGEASERPVTDEDLRARPDDAANSAPIRLGRVGVRPYVTFSYLDADTVSGDPPQILNDQYLQIQPGVGAQAPIGLGQLSVSYEPRLRQFSSIPEVEVTTHWLNGTLTLPVGSRVSLDARSHYSKGVLEATEVDPGGEYFFGLGEFEHLDFGVGADIEVGPRVRLHVGADARDISVAPEASFFSYAGRSARADLSYEISPNLRGGLGYFWSDIPSPVDRPEAEATAHSATFYLLGDLAPLTTGRVDVFYTAQDNPNAGPGGRSYRGITTRVGLRRELGHSSALDVNVMRGLYPSNFEDDGFYVVTSTEGVLTVGGPWETRLRAGVGYRWSDYRTDAEGLDGPRADRTLGWYVGASRPFGEHILTRVEYRRDRRQSNVRAGDITIDALLLEIGFGWFGGGR